MTIPKIIIQTSKNPIPENVVKKLKSYAPNWEYLFFDDNDIITFFNNHTIHDFPTILQVYNKIQNGAHRSDLFRYAFLYKFGGVFIDSDAMLQVSLDDIVKDYDFFSVKSFNEDTIFQGFLGVSPNHFIIRQCLEDALNIDIVQLQADYLLLCKNMNTFIHQVRYQESELCKLYVEYNDESDQKNRKAIIINEEDGIPILIHYYQTKVIPL
jgi:mannosyltransferase OCH1-like enzyme